MSKQNFLLVALALSATFLAVEGLNETLYRVEVRMGCRDLPNYDVCCSPPVYAPDVYAIVYYAASDFDSYVEQGRTRILSDNNNPEWDDVFAFNLFSNSKGRIKIDVMDSDVDADDYMGYFECTIQEILKSFGNVVEHALINSNNSEGNGFLKLKATVRNASQVSPDENEDSKVQIIPNARYPMQQALKKLINPKLASLRP